MSRIQNILIKRYRHQNAFTKLKTTPNKYYLVFNLNFKIILNVHCFLFLNYFFSFWGKISLAQRDPIISINQLYQQDPNPNKINLSIGTYRTENYESYVFPSIRKAEKIVFDDCRLLDKEYSPIEGFMPFNQEAFKLIFGDHTLEKSVRMKFNLIIEINF